MMKLTKSPLDILKSNKSSFVIVLATCFALAILAFSLHHLFGNIFFEPVPRKTCLQAVRAGACDVSLVTLAQIVANSEKFHMSKVKVTGLASIAFENMKLSQSKEASARESLWLDISDKAVETEAEAHRYQQKFQEWQKQFHEKSVVVEGTFDMTNKGHFGLFPGALKDITRIELVNANLVGN